MAVFVLIPFADVGKRSFQTAVTGKFCGIANYREIFTNQAFLAAVKNTLKFEAVGLPAAACDLACDFTGVKWM